MNSARWYLPIVFALFTVSACSGESPSGDGATGVVASGKIIGTNDLVPVVDDGANIAEKYRPLIDAFGNMSMGCTGTHVGNGIVLSAGHCFNAPSTRINDRPCTGKTIAWGYRKDKPSYLTSKCTSILAMEQNSTRDYSIFRVDPVPPVKLAVRFDTRPALDTKLTIFSHPETRPLEWSGTCILRPGAEGEWGADMISHQCDTEPGSSGATVLDDQTLEVVAIHDGGRVPWNYATYLQATPIAEYFGTVANQLPVVAFDEPLAGASVSGTVDVAATATDPDGTVAKVTFALPDGSSVESTVAPFRVTWDTTRSGDGSRTIQATATDNAGATAVATVTVTVDNGVGHWSATSSPNLALVDDGTACTDVEVVGAGFASDVKLDLDGQHKFRSVLRATLEHRGVKQTVFEVRTLPSGSGPFTFNAAAVPGFTGVAAGTWHLCVTDTDAHGDTGIISRFNVHD